MEIIRAESPTMDSWQTSVTAGIYPFAETDDRLLSSGCWEECALVCNPSDFVRLIDHSVGQFHNHRGDRDYAQNRARFTRHVLPRF